MVVLGKDWKQGEMANLAVTKAQKILSALKSH